MAKRASYTQKILIAATEYYFSSGHYNGFVLDKIRRELGIPPNQIKKAVAHLINKGSISLIWLSNFHIRLFKDKSVEEQLKALKPVGLLDACIYPTPQHLHGVVDKAAHQNSPFTLELLLGEPQLKSLFFDVRVLSSYRNDPRLRFDNNDIGGHIWATDNAIESGQVSKHDNVYIKSFGFAFESETMKRVLTVFLCDLSHLTPEQQVQWKTRQLDGQYTLHPDFVRTSFHGEFPERLSLCDAFVEELKVINAMAEAMGKPNLFRETYDFRTKPQEFCMLLWPTQKEFYQFTHTLDKMISDNLNKGFFGNDISLFDLEPQKDGTVERKPKGTLSLLEDWIKGKFRPMNDPHFIDDIFTTLRKIRKLRQPAAHTIISDKYDEAFYERQRQLLIEAYKAIRHIRLIFANHPGARAVTIREELYEGRIWNY